MQIHIRQSKASQTPNLVEYVEQRLRFALARFNGDVKSVLVCLDHPHTAACTVEIRTVWGAPITIREQQRELSSSISRAIDRAGRAVDRLAIVSAGGLKTG